MLSHSFGSPSGGRDAPQIHLQRFPRSAHKIDPAAVCRPDLKVVMLSRRRSEDLTRVLAVAVPNKHRITGIISVEDQTAAVRRPRDICRMITQERAWISTH